MALNPNLKRGLAVGCGLIFLAFMLIFGGTIYFARQMGKDYKVVKELELQLAEQHGPSGKLPTGYSGLPDPDRLEAFLAVRQASAEWRLQVETSFARLMAGEGADQAEGIRHFLRVLKASRDLAPVFSGFWISRNQALLDQQMGMGEYIYLYCLSYHSWLQYDPSDGARDAGALLSGLGATGPMSDPKGQDQDEELDELERRQWAWAQENRLMLPLLQQAAREDAQTGDPDLAAWVGQLQLEVRALQDDSLRVPFADGVPVELSSRLEPYRAALTGSYSLTVNPIELLFEDTWEDKK